VILHSVTGSWRHERTRWQAWVGMLDRRRKFGGTGAHSPKKHSRPTAAKLLYASCVAARATTALSAEWAETNLPQRGPVSGMCRKSAQALSLHPSLSALQQSRPKSGTFRLDRASAVKSPSKNPEGRN